MQKATMTGLRFFSLVTVSLLLGLASCKKDKKDDGGSNPPPPPAGSKIKEYKNGDEFVRFTYNTDGTIQKATVSSDLNTGGQVVDFNITYNAQKKITEINTSLFEKIVPTYENGNMIRAEYFDGAVRTAYTNYTYEAGNLRRATIYINQGNDFEPYLEFLFSYNGSGNITKTEIFMATDVPNQLTRVGHVNYQHDQKTNPLYAQKEFLAILWQAASKNNIIKEDHFDGDQNPEEVTTYTYTYKSNGLPEKAVVKTGVPGGPQETSELIFTYQ